MWCGNVPMVMDELVACSRAVELYCAAVICSTVENEPDCTAAVSVVR